MKVITNPEPKRIACSRCHALLEYEVGDVFRKLIGAGPRQRIYTHCVKCPCCGGETSVER